MIENSCFECAYYKENWCRIFGYYFKLYVAKKTTCETYKETCKEKEPAILLRSDPTLVDRMRDKERK